MQPGSPKERDDDGGGGSGEHGEEGKMSGAEKLRGEDVEISDAGEQRGGADVGESENERRRGSEGDAEEENGNAERDEEKRKIVAIG